MAHILRKHLHIVANTYLNSYKNTVKYRPTLAILISFEIKYSPQGLILKYFESSLFPWGKRQCLKDPEYNR